MAQPSRGEVWMVDLNPIGGHEQGGRRLGLVISVDPFNQGSAGIVVMIHITPAARGIPFHVEVDPPEGGVRKRSFIKCEDLRSVSTERLWRRVGKVSPKTLMEVEDRLRILLNL